MLNLTRLHLGIAHESQFQGLGISLLGIDPATNQLYSDGKRPVLRDRIVTLGALNGFFCRAYRHWHMRRLLLTFCFGATLDGPPPIS